MSKIPFRRFVITLLLLNRDIAYILQKLGEFRYNAKEEDIRHVFDEVRDTLPEKHREWLNSGQPFKLDDQYQVQWMKQFGVFEVCDYIIRESEKLKDPPPYFKWIEDCLWIHRYEDVMSIVNILIFNGEPIDNVSKIISFKFKNKVGVEALELYRRLFWDVEAITAKEAIYYCVPFRNNSLIIRKMRGGETEIEFSQNASSSHDGSDVDFMFHDNNYVKWKIGYKDIAVPASKDFLEQVQKDSYFKYYEAINMTHSVEEEEEQGNNDKLGDFSVTRTKRRNVEEQRAKMAKGWLDIYLKAKEAMPSGEKQDASFFERMDQLEMDFSEDEDEKIARIDDMRDVLEDIKGDMG